MENKIILKRLYNDYTKKFLPKILLSVFFSLIVAGSTAAIAWLLDPAIKKIFIDKDEKLILIIPVAIILAFSLKGGSLYFAKTILIRTAQEITKIIQMQVMKSLITADTEVIDKKHTGKFISHLTFDVSLISRLVSNVILNLTKDSFTLIGLLIVMFYQNWKLAFFAIIMIPLATIAARSLGKRIGKVTVEAADRTGELSSYLIEIFKNHKIIKIFQKENYEFGRTEKFINNLKEKVVKIETVLVRASPIMETLTGLMIALLIFYSGKLIMSGELGLNNFFSFLAAMMLAYQPVRSLATLNMSLNQGLAAARRILPLIDIENKIKELENAKELKISKGEIKFEKVNFKYNKDEGEVLNDIDIFIEGGEMTSLVGHSGAGKSSLLNLIPRFYDRNNGDIKIDNQSIYKTKIRSLRSNISLVSQNIFLFADSIYNNIVLYNKKISINKVVEAAKKIGIHNFITKLPNSYNYNVKERGIMLSEGQKQLISFLRAYVNEPSILILDEATSSIDSKTEKLIQYATSKIIENKTSIIIAHRLSTILNSDKIILLDKGEIKEIGTHDELLKIHNGYYKKLFELQFQKEELVT